MPKFNVENYVDVNARIQAFWTKYPNGRILTDVRSLDSPETTQRMVVVTAQVYADREDARPLTTGLAKEREGTAGANQTAFLENAETSAIGRALANAGFLVDRGRASKEEMEAVNRRQEEHATALQQLKQIAKINKDAHKRVGDVWEKAKTDPTYAISLVQELKKEFAEKT